jgi:ParB family chromosome partitioning protein
MAEVRKITLSASRDIPFNKLVLSQSNVRRIKAGVSIEELAEDIARRTLLQSLTVRPVRDEAGNETGIYEIPAGGRRYRALALLVKQKRLSRTAPIPCIVRDAGIAEEDSLAENIHRAPLHPLDQFRAFLALREKGQSEEEIAAVFFVSVGVVKQRLRLAAVSPKLLFLYEEDALTLDQLMAFTVNADHARQEQVYDRLTVSFSKEPHVIRKMLTEGAVRAVDKRAQFIGLDAYRDAGGTLLRDLFEGDDGGWLEDVALVDRLVAEKLAREADAVRAEGWKWLDVAPDFPYGHTFGLRRLFGETVAMSLEEEAARTALQAEYDGLEAAHPTGDLPEAVDRRLAEIETARAAYDERPVRFDPAEIAIAGAFVSIDRDGVLRVERGYVRPEDEPPIEPDPATEMPSAESTDAAPENSAAPSVAASSGTGAVLEAVEPAEPEEDDGLKPIPERLLTELTAYRCLTLRQALGEQPDVAFLAALHALCLKAFYRYAPDSCLELDVKLVTFGNLVPGLNDTSHATELARRHQAWHAALPKDSGALWDVLTGFELDSRQALFAHCVALALNGVFDPYNRRPRALAHADLLAEALDLDMVRAGWTPTAENYLGRVTKARILAAVSESRGDDAAKRIAPLKKAEMAEAAAALLAGTGWLPEALRTPKRAAPVAAGDRPAEAAE